MIKKILILIILLQIIKSQDFYDKCSIGNKQIKNLKCDQYLGINGQYITDINYNIPAYGCMKNIPYTYPKFIINSTINYTLNTFCPGNKQIVSHSNNALNCGLFNYNGNAYDTYGSYIKCLSGCNYINGKCVSNKGFKCDKKIEYICPYKCTYNNITDKCDPISYNDICTFNKRTYQCPQNCHYNSNINTCIPNDNYYIICDKQLGLVCPSMCKLNDNGDKCLSYYDSKILCDTEPKNICPSDNCIFNNNYNRCISKKKDINDICYPTIEINCQKYYSFNITGIKKCTIYNKNNICYITNTSIQFPQELYDKYKNYKCHYDYPDISCDIGAIQKCPTGCILDDKVNRCYYSEKNTICDMSWLTCMYSDTGCGSNINGCTTCSTNKCPNNYKLIKLYDSYYKQNYTYCGPNYIY